MLEGFLNDEAHRLYLGASLFAEFHHALGSIAIGEEVVDKDDMVVGSKIAVAHTNRIVTVLGERVNHRSNHTLHRLGLFLLDEDHWKMGQITYHDGRSDTRCLNGDDLVVLNVLEQTNKLLRQIHHQDRIHLVIYETVYF